MGEIRAQMKARGKAAKRNQLAPGSGLEKKDGTNGLAVRAGRPVTQTTSDLENHLHNRNKYTIA
jgi:hypothetical protein